MQVTGTGELRAIAGGTADIIAWTSNDVSARITVEVDPTVDVELLTLNVTQAAISTDETLQLAVSYLPTYATYQTVEWTSSDETVAVVDENGLVTASGVGSAVIAAIAHNGVKAQCTVNVHPLVDTVLLAGAENADSFARGTTLQLTAEAFPAEALNRSVKYASSDTTIATVDASGLVSFVGSGYVTITATAADRGVVKASIELECLADAVLNLPASTKTIEDEAFAGSAVECVVVPEGATSIGMKAFANCTKLYKIIIPDSVTEIDANAFEGSARVTICAPEGSRAQTFASERGLAFRVHD